MKPQHIDADLLYEYIKKSGLFKKFICQQLGISTTAFHNKCVGKTAFRVSEIYVLCHLLKIPDEDKEKIFYPKS